MSVISREAAIEALRRAEALTKAFGYHHVIDTIRELPTFEQNWTPVSERLPKNDDWVIVTILDEWGDTPWTYADFGWYLEAANCWIIDAQQRTDVIAWMPLPDPWKGKEE